MKNKLGSINPCEKLLLYDKNKKLLGECLNTPNSFAVACYINNNIAYGRAYYQFFDDNIRKRNDKDNIERIDMLHALLENNNVEDFNSIKKTIKWY